MPVENLIDLTIMDAVLRDAQWVVCVIWSRNYCDNALLLLKGY